MMSKQVRWINRLTEWSFCRRSEPAGIALVDGIVAREAVEVDASLVADGVAGEEPAGEAVVEAVAEQVTARVVMVVAELTAESDRVVDIVEFLAVGYPLPERIVDRAGCRDMDRAGRAVGRQGKLGDGVALRVIGGGNVTVSRG